MKRNALGKLTGSLIEVDSISDEQKEQMFALMECYYQNLSKNKFKSDLVEKEKVILLTETMTGRVCGFSTQQTIELVVSGRPVQVLFSGDTIIDRHYWHSNPLAKIWGQMVLALLESCPNGELYWLLLSKGFRTYRYLPVFFNEFYPRYDKQMPVDLQNIVSAVIEHKGLRAFNPTRCILQAENYSLNGQYAPIEPRRLHDPHVQFFVNSNPGYVKGDELCCIAPIRTDNFRRSAYRVMR